MDDLVLTLSRRREVSWPTFRAHTVEIVGQGWSASAVLNGLVACGHAAASFKGGVGVVWNAPRVLALLPDLPPSRAVLVGHRTSEIERDLRKACNDHGAALEVGDDDGCPFAPHLLKVIGDPDSLARVAAAVQALFHPDPAAWRLTQFVGDLAAYEAELSWLPRADLGGWGRARFDPDSLLFVPAATQQDGLTEFRHPTTGRRVYWYRRGDQAAEVDRNWGRYLSLKDAGRTGILTTSDGGLRAPLGALPPDPLAAALGLCSGRPPALARADAERGLVYRDVPPEIAERVARKLGQMLTRPSPRSSE